ncbi:hypothetical protein F4808DRAFT_436426 [Astrocystis sublimbata]|nr:hypothetical protein F4808DRAFT_436426 [Astrocystis sublimbata]
MEALATVQTISNIVQLIEVGRKCLSKGVELYRSNDGVLDDNAAIKDAATYLATLSDAVRSAACSTADESLRSICTKVAEAAAELLGVLDRLKVEGTRTKWKSMRKAIKSVWSREKVQELDARLARFREELNLHVCVETRQQLKSLETRVAPYLDNCDARTKEILDAILSGADVFQRTLSDQSVLIRDEHEATRRHSELHHATTRQETRQALLQIESNLKDIVSRGTEINRTQNEETQSHMLQVMEALRRISEQSRGYHEELRSLIIAREQPASDKTRERLRERSRAATAAIIALETMDRYLQELLEALQSGVSELVQKARSSELWPVIKYMTAASTPPRDGGVEMLSETNHDRRRKILGPDLHELLSILSSQDHDGLLYTAPLSRQRVHASDASERYVRRPLSINYLGNMVHS